MAAMLAQGMLALTLVIRVYDQYGLPADHLARARSAAEGIMNAAGVRTMWPPCPCLSPVTSRELVIRITRASSAGAAGSLGFSYVDIGRQTGTLATVFADRVQALAVIAGVDDGELLGRVIAHEVSHLLLGTRDHSPHGLMRAEWRASELVQRRPSDWLFSRAEGRQIRQAVRRRLFGSRPAMISADADPTPNVNAQ